MKKNTHHKNLDYIVLDKERPIHWFIWDEEGHKVLIGYVDMDKLRLKGEGATKEEAIQNLHNQWKELHESTEENDSIS